MPRCFVKSHPHRINNTNPGGGEGVGKGNITPYEGDTLSHHHKVMQEGSKEIKFPSYHVFRLLVWEVFNLFVSIFHAEKKRNFSFMHVIIFSLIFYAFAFSLAWCESAPK